MQPLSARPMLGSPRLVGSNQCSVARLSTQLCPAVDHLRDCKGRWAALTAQSPLAGYSEAEMIHEARLRMEHNKARHRLKHLLNTAAEGGPTVHTQDLLLACKLAKMDTSLLGLNEDGAGSPRKIAMHRLQQLPYPPLHGRGAFGDLPPTKSQLKLREKNLLPLNAAGQPVSLMQAAKDENVSLRATDEELYHHWFTLKRLMETRFSELRRAFRLIDEDSSGSADRSELKFMLNAMFNLSIPEHVLDRMIDLADFDGDGSINFAEFARIMTADNILKLKNTLVADTSAWGSKDPEKALVVDYHDLADKNRQMAAGGYEGSTEHAKLRRTGASLAQLRKRTQHTRSSSSRGMTPSRMPSTQSTPTALASSGAQSCANSSALSARASPIR